MSIPQASQLFTAIGAITTLKAAYDLTSFLYHQLLSPPTYGRYLYGDAPYALVTGATDGIGKAFAKELYNKGFNLIIHGRNPEKLDRAREEILSSPGVKHKDVRLWVADASAPEVVDFASALKEWEDIVITLVIHNVGGGIVRPNRIDAIPKEILLGEFNLNAIFPWLLTRALLPKLRTSRGPVELVFIGSGTASFPMPGIVPSSTGKAFIRQLSLAISADEQFRQPSNVTTLYLNIGGVASDQRGRKPSLFEPAPQDFAKSAVAKIGSGRSVEVPWIWHALLVWVIEFVPESLFRKMLLGIAETEMATKAKVA